MKIDKVHRALFINDEKTLIMVNYTDENGGEQEDVTQILPGNEFFEDLLKQRSLEQIEEDSIEDARATIENAKLWDEFLVWKERGGEVLSMKSVQEVPMPVDKFLDSTDPEDLFKVKLKIFENDIIKKSKDRKTRSMIRKAKTPLEAFMAAALIYNENQT